MLDVGSKVRFIASDIRYDDATDSPVLTAGSVGTVVDINPGTAWPYECVFPSVMIGRFALDSQEVEAA